MVKRRDETLMKIGIPKEIFAGEKRVALTPQSALALQKLGYDCLIEAGAGDAARFADDLYREAGVTVVPARPSSGPRPTSSPSFANRNRRRSTSPIPARS